LRLKLTPREMALLALVAAATFVWLWQPFGDEGAAPTQAVPRIDLARIEAPPPEVEIGRRDLFSFGAPRRPAGVEESSATTPIATPPPRTAASPAGGTTAGAGGSGLPAMNLRFIGSVGNERGVKVAVLVTERNEVLTGQPGDVIANRYRIEKIGIESVDLQDVGTGQSRRIPLKGD
jgi:hypothetical protein